MRRPSAGIFPGPERTFGHTAKGPLHLRAQFATPAGRRAAGRKRLLRHHQAGGALAGRRVNLPWAIVRNRTPFLSGFRTAA